MATAIAASYTVLVAVATWHAIAGTDGLGAPITYVVGASIVLMIARARPAVPVVVRALAVAGTLLSAWALVAFGQALARHAGEPASYHLVKVEVVTPVASHNVLASVLLVGLVATVLAIDHHRAWWAATVLMTLGLASTLSRGAVLVAVLLPLAALVALRDRHLAARLAVATLASLALVLTAAAVLDASVPNEGDPTSVASRVQLWEAAWDAFTQSPAVGVGFDGFHDHAEAAGVADPRDHAHNLLLHAAATGGIGALVGVAVLWGALVVGGGRTIDPGARGLVLLGGGALLAHALIEETVTHPPVEVLVALLLGLALAERLPARPGGSGTGR